MQRRSSRQLQRGFTLAEVLVATAVFAVIMIAALAVYDQSNRVFVTGSQSSDLQQSTRIGFDRLVADIRMAGFDYSRGGTPQDITQFPQPDEQIEYAGVNVLVFRANFNYNTASIGCQNSTFGDPNAQPCDNGVEPEITPLVNGKPVFPYVTTSNSEIIIYALRSANAAKNTNEISFWADVHMPFRAAYPNSPTNGKEQMVTLGPLTCGTCGIDTTGNNPPYTLYRITVADVLAGAMGTPVAENIRTLRFFYYTDANGTNLLKDPNSTSNPPTDISTTRNASTSDDVTSSAMVPINGVGTPTGAIGGAGQYVINSAGTVVPDAKDPLDRNARSTITSIRADLIGMNSAPDGGYTNPSEPVAALQHYREYTLSALITPRNLGLSGYPEQNYAAPVPPTVTGVCTGFCAAPVICWTPGSGGGPVVQYVIGIDSSPNGAFATQYPVVNPSATSAVIPDLYGIDPTRTWYYKVNAVNNNGSSPWADLAPTAVSPINTTKPLPPTGLGGVPQQYAVNLGWTAASNHDPSNDTLTCIGTCVADGSVITTAENISFKIYRGSSISFDPSKGDGVVILSNTKAQPTVAPGTAGQFVDGYGTSAYPAAACTPYYYRIQEMNRCSTNPNWNNPTQTSQATSDYGPTLSQPAYGPVQATDAGPTVMASAPPALTVDTTVSACPAPPSNSICSITLKWPQVTTDTAGNHIAVDRYQITRMVKHSSDSVSNFKLDSNFGTNGYLSYAGQSYNNTGTVKWTDPTAPAYDSCGNANCAFTYEYIVQAYDCRVSWPCKGGNGDTSCLPTAQFPSACNQAPATLTSTAQSTDAFGCLIFNGGDTIKVTSGNTSLNFQSVQVFVNNTSTNLTINPGGSGGLDSATWLESGLQSSTDTPVTFVITYTNGCTETKSVCVTDEGAAKCFLTATETPPYATEQGKTLVTGGSTTTVTESYPIANNTASVPANAQFSGDSLYLTSQPFSIVYTIPSGFSDIALSQVTFGASNVAVLANQISCVSSTCTFSGNAPSSLLLISPTSPGNSLALSVKWTYKKNDGTLSSATPLLQKFCIGYQLSTTPGSFTVDNVDKSVHHCDVIGVSGGNNPASCN